MKNSLGPEYASPEDRRFKAACFCGAVQYEVSADPVDAKICHCLTGQRLNGAPMQWAAIFHKHHVRITAGLAHLFFLMVSRVGLNAYCPAKSAASDVVRQLPLTGGECGLPSPPCLISDTPPNVTDLFKPTCHIFYGTRVMEPKDDLSKWSGHKNHSNLV